MNAIGRNATGRRKGDRGKSIWPPTSWPLLRQIDYVVFPDGREVHLIHQPGCPRSMTADGLCSCVSPEMFEVRP